MRYVVVGAGAIGGSVGVRPHEAGRPVLLVARGPHLAAIRERGLRLDEPSRSRVARLPVACAVAEVDWRPGDVALLCTKTQDSVGVLDQLCGAARAEGERCLAAAGIDYASDAEQGEGRRDVMATQLLDGHARRGGSTWRSLHRGSASVEADFINGEIVALGRRHGRPTPVNALLVGIVDAMARAGEQPGGRRAADLLTEARTAAELLTETRRRRWRPPDVHSALSGTSQMPSSD